MLIICKHQKSKKIYRPGHIPEFENPENEETDTYYGLNSSRLFPDREKGRVNRSAFEEENKKEQGNELLVCRTQTTPSVEGHESTVLKNLNKTTSINKYSLYSGAAEVLVLL